MPHDEPGLAFHCCIVFIGFCCMTSSSISLVMAALYMTGKGSPPEDNLRLPHLIASTVMDVLAICCDIALLVAVAKQVPRLVMLWVVTAPMRGVGQVVIAGIVCAKYHERSSMVYIDAVFTGIFMLCLVFFANVCFNYHRVMSARNRRMKRAAARWQAADGEPPPPIVSAGVSFELQSGGSWVSAYGTDDGTDVGTTMTSSPDLEGRRSHSHSRSTTPAPSTQAEASQPRTTAATTAATTAP